MGDFLTQQGYTCLGIRLAGHATKPEDMVHSLWTDWTTSVEDGYHLLRGIVDNIFLVGLSMGGILSLLMSTRLDVKGVVAMSTPHRLPVDYPLWAMRLMSTFMRYRPKGSAEPGSGWFDPTAWMDHISYPQNPVRSVVELELLLLEMQKALPNVKVPVLLIHSNDDTYVVSQNMQAIYEGLHSASDKTKLAITGSGHVLPRDAARRQVFQSTLEFLQRIESSKEST